MNEDKDRPGIDVGRLIDERPMSAMQITVVVLCAVAIFLDGYDLQAMSLAVPSLARQWGRPPEDFGLALAAAQIGLSLGGAVLAHFGDRLGRRIAVIGSLLLFGLATVATATAATPGEFVFWRILTGIGIGACVPNCNAWTAEYVPERFRSVIVVAMNAAVGLGAFSAGFIAPPLLHAIGWRGIFMVGGIAPIVTAGLVLLAAPESLKFLMTRRAQDGRIGKIVSRVAPDVDPTQLYLIEPQSAPHGSARVLLNSVFRSRTLLLWGMVMLNFFTLYVLISWLPTLLEDAGWSTDNALQGAVLIQLGGVVGGIGLSFLLDRGLTRASLRGAWLAAGISFLLFLVVPSGLYAWGALLLIVGAGISGSQLCLNALSTAYYPPAIKATGFGWVGVIGGFGSIVAPLAGAWIIAHGVPSTGVLVMLVVPVLLCMGGTLLMRPEWQAH